MTRKPAATPVVETPATVDPVAPETVETVQSVAADDLAYLVAQCKALNEQIKAAKEAKKGNKNKLDAVIARQNSNVSDWVVNYLSQRIRARVNAKQSQDVALEEVFELYQHAVYLALETSTAETSTAE